MRRFAVLFWLGMAAAVTMTVVSSSAAAQPGPNVRSHPTVWINGSGVQGQLPAAASKQVRALVKNAMRRVQASGDVNYCGGGTADNSIPNQQRCTFTGSAGVCIQKSSDPNETQVCKFTQGPSMPTARTNLAIALQVIMQKTAIADTQNGKQVVKVNQRNTTKPNLAFVAQFIKQSFGPGAHDDNDTEISDEAAIEVRAQLLGTLPNYTPLVDKLQSKEPLTEGDETAAATSLGGPVTQIQQSQQTVRICQGGTDISLGCTSPVGMFSNNLSGVYQSLRQREKAKNASEIDQQQNPLAGTCDDEDPLTGEPPRNMCALVDQNTTGGKNISGVAELYRQFQSGAHTESLTQLQDPTFADNNGIDHDIHQLSVVSDPAGPQRNWIWTFQLGRQVQRAKNADFVDQFQDPRTAKGPFSTQVGTFADTWFGRMFASQRQTTDGQPTIPDCCSSGQRQLLTYDADATGVIDVLVRGSNNGDSDEIRCNTGQPGDPCHVVVQCFGASPGEGEPSPADCQAFPTESEGPSLRLRR